MYQNLQPKLESLLAENGLTGVEKNKLRQFIAMLTDFVSVWFRKGTILSVPKHDQDLKATEKEITAFMKPAFDRENGTGNPAPYLDTDIWGWDSFKGKKFPKMAAELSLAIYRFLKTITHRQILEEGEAKNIKRIGTFTEALATVRAAILAGEVDQRGTGVIAYFTVPGNDQIFRFDAWRDDVGQLYVHVDKIVLVSKWNAEYGVVFSN